MSPCLFKWWVSPCLPVFDLEYSSGGCVPVFGSIQVVGVPVFVQVVGVPVFAVFAVFVLMSGVCDL
jgi:hypothetical protein